MSIEEAPFSPDVAEALSRIGSRKRSVIVHRDVELHPEMLHSCWDGGSRDLYLVLRNGNSFFPPTYSNPFERNGSAHIYEPQAGDVLIRYGTFRGEIATPSVTFYAKEKV